MWMYFGTGLTYQVKPWCDCLCYGSGISKLDPAASIREKAFCNLYEEKNNYIQAGEGHIRKILRKTKGKNSKLQKIDKIKK